MYEEENEDIDPLRERFWDLRWDWRDYWDTNIDRSLDMIQEAIEIAKQLNEPIWELEMRHWLAQALIFKKRNYAEALPLAVETAIEARKPIYRETDTRICVYQDLIAAYVGVDAIGYASKIESALENMQAEAPHYSQCRRCLMNEKVGFEIARKDGVEALSANQEYLSISRTSYHRSSAHENFVILYFWQKEWESMLEHAKKCVDIATDEQIENEIFGLMGQAVALQKLGRMKEASDAFKQSESRKEVLDIAYTGEYYELVVEYFVSQGNLNKAINARQEQIDKLTGRGAVLEEAEAWVDLCRLEKRIGNGEISADSLQNARDAISKLKISEGLTQKLNEVLDS